MSPFQRYSMSETEKYIPLSQRKIGIGPGESPRHRPQLVVSIGWENIFTTLRERIITSDGLRSFLFPVNRRHEDRYWWADEESKTERAR